MAGRRSRALGQPLHDAPPRRVRSGGSPRDAPHPVQSRSPSARKRLMRECFAGARFLVALSSLCICVCCSARGAGTTRFVLDGNRMYAELGFVRPDGSIHRALAFVDMGSPAMTLRQSLFKDLQLDEKRPLAFRVGGLSVVVPRAQVTSEQRE